MRVYVEGIGLLGPGLNGWKNSIPLLKNTGEWKMYPLCVPDPVSLPAVERRRAGQAVRLALAVGFEAHVNAQRDPSGTETVFTSSGGDSPSLHTNCEALAHTNPEVSPTRFHNSVHNAPAGYWGIASRSREPSTSLCAFDASFAVGLLHSTVHVLIDHRVVALIAYDVPYMDPIDHVRPIISAFATSFLLTPEKTEHAIACLDIMRMDGRKRPWLPVMDPDMAKLSLGTPAGRSLPLLIAIASGVTMKVDIEELPGHRLEVEVSAC
ncbi:MAG: beta-ketoacyl synthase chain length factor [Leptospirillum sp.]